MLRKIRRHAAHVVGILLTFHTGVRDTLQFRSLRPVALLDTIANMPQLHQHLQHDSAVTFINLYNWGNLSILPELINQKHLRKLCILSLVTSTTVLPTSLPFLPNPNSVSHALGVRDGVLSECIPARLCCVSSQDDAPKSFLEPFFYDTPTNTKAVRDTLEKLILAEPGARLIERDGQYSRFEINVPFSNSGGGIDDLELFFPDDDNVVHFRSEARAAKFDGWRNRRRMNSLRVKARLEAVPVLRGRSSFFGLFESPFDEFGPSAADPDVIIEKGGISSRATR